MLGRMKDRLFDLPSRGEAESSPFASVAVAERGTLVSALVTALTPRQRAVIVLHYGEEMSLVAIAELFGVTDSAVSAAHQRALCSMRQQLGAEGITGLGEL